ncbi:hypothetical protein SPRG_13032 [Saprolegnia parasitica CBS 223.65]|uniref:Uncharacterized protein n=1 Tax=Saprolegnia parasitica (strain CBS 223.65) TaxID=695850 RepID=A0A067BT89_SAPPC|nr:hypothetical protein SPRG_13032 [Saprolegnia parasitica CBS 223.65]KDO21694.1 hypothetical protein SPRG_13032 [Saprolegnia parasitica CBS 223.65]|eukprot:XP_012207616.1 hypothetical protein SPRG_13032 [Saprolegnia parasitica CBS 223.65]
MTMTQNYRMCLTEARKRNVYIVARLLNDSASKSKLPATKLSAKLPLVAYKMEHRINEVARGRVLDEKTIKVLLLHLIQQAHRRRRQQHQLQQQFTQQQQQQQVPQTRSTSAAVVAAAV